MYGSHLAIQHSSGKQVGIKRSSPMDQLAFASACTLAAAIRDKTVSVKEVVQAHIDQINAVNPAINAWCNRPLSARWPKQMLLMRPLPRGKRSGLYTVFPLLSKTISRPKGSFAAVAPLAWRRMCQQKMRLLFHAFGLLAASCSAKPICPKLD